MDCRCLLILLLTGLSLALPRNRLDSLKSKLNSVERVGIYRGQNTTIEKHPYLVQVLVEENFICAGTIVSSNYIITLGSCVLEDPSSITIVAGGNDLGAGITYKVKKLIPHPKYEFPNFDYNYALIKIKGNFTWGRKVGNVSLPSKPPAAHTSVTVAGWGTTTIVSSEYPNYKLQQGIMKLQTKKICASYYTDYPITFNDLVGCAYNRGKTTLCDGDYGDPFVKDNVLYGMFMMYNIQEACSDYAAPVVISNVAPVVGWIQKHIGET